MSLPFNEAKEQYLSEAERRLKPSTLESYAWLLERHFKFDKRLSEINRKDIMDVIQPLAGKPSQQYHAFVAIRTMMNWCVRRGLIEYSVVPPLSFKTSDRSRILTDDELREIWQCASACESVFGDIVRMLILTGQRRGETSRLRSEWITQNSITIPETETKNKREHTFPIGSLSQSIITRNDPGIGLLFPSTAGDDKPFNGWSKCKRRFDRDLSFSDYTLHDLRRTFASNHTKLGTPIQVTEKLLNHVSGSFSGGSGVYNRYSYMDEMRDACLKYEEWIASNCS